MITESAQVLFEIAKIGGPTTVPMLREKLPDMSTARLYSAIGNNFRLGKLIRTGECRLYAYSLSESLQALVKAKGAEAAMHSISNQRTGEPLPPALQPIWPALQRSAPLRPTVRAPLPWDGEEEVPPCIGERYREALRPQPMDD